MPAATIKFSECIICKKPPKSGESLTTEHVIPYALGGHLTVPQSVCVRCAHQTSISEAKVLRGAFHAFRLKVGLQSRSRGRLESLPIFCVNEVENERIDLPIVDYPVILPLPRFGPAAIVTGAPLQKLEKPWFFVEDADVQKLFEQYGVKVFATMSLDTLAFAQMLAKIAHVFLVRERGVDGFEPLLPSFILDRANRKLLNFVESEGSPPPVVSRSEITHTIGISTRSPNHSVLISCDIRLFANLGAPLYHVIAGREIPTNSKIPNVLPPKKECAAQVRAMIACDGVHRDGWVPFRGDARGVITPAS